MLPERRPVLGIGVTLLMAIAWLAYWWPELSGERVIFMRDITLFALPSKHIWLSRILAGELPHWLPQVSAGIPYLADPSNQTFYPPNLLMMTSATPLVALNRFMLAHLLVGMLGMAALARAVGLSALAAVVAGGVFGFSGYVVSIVENLTYVPGIAWMPVALAAWLRFARDGSRRAWLVAALAVALMLLAGDALDAVGVCTVMFLLACVGPAGSRVPVNLPTALAALTALAVLAVIVAAVQVLPTLDMFAYSVRAAGMELVDQSTWSMPPPRALELVQPYLFGSNFPAFDYLAADRYPAMRSPWVDSIHVGLLPVLLALAAVLARPRRALPWFLLASLALLLAMGSHLPGYDWLVQHLPLARTQRYPEKLLVWTTLALAVLTGMGVDALRATEGPFARLAAARAFERVLLSLGMLALQFFLLIDWPARALVWQHAHRESLLWSERTGLPLTHAQGLLLHAAPLAVVLLVVWWAPARRYAALAVLLGAASIADLVWVHRGHMVELPPQVAIPATTAAGTLLDGHGGAGARVFFDDLAPGKFIQYTAGRLAARLVPVLGGGRDGHLEGYLPAYAMLLQMERLTTQFGVFLGRAYLNGRYSPLQPAAHFELERFIQDQAADRLLAASGTRHVITSIEPVNLAWELPRLVEVARDEDVNVRLLAVVDPYPFVRIAAGVERAPEEVDYAVLADLVERRPRAALLEAPAATLAALAGVVPDATVVDWRRPLPERIEVTVDNAAGAALLVLTESWASGWQATVDGEVVRPLRADLRMLAVPLPAGAREVVLEFRTPRLALGASLSALGLLLAGTLWWRGARR